MQFSVKDNVDEVLRRTKDFQQNQQPFAIALALTRTSQQIKDIQQQKMREVFDQPTPYTLNAIFVTPATKSTLTSSTFFKEFASKGTPAPKYLMPEVQG